jgi:hypothetical protein
MYNTEGPEIMRLYNAKDNTEHHSFTDVLDSVYNNVNGFIFSGCAQNITILCFSVHSYMPSSHNGRLLIPMKKVLYHPNSEDSML